MKKYILCILLALAFLLSACGEAIEQSVAEESSLASESEAASMPEEGSSEEDASEPEPSEDPSDDPSEDPSDDPSEPEDPSDDPSDDPSEEPPVSSISSVDRTLRSVELAKGCKYTSSAQTSEQYMDKGTLLTDGNIPTDSNV